MFLQIKERQYTLPLVMKEQKIAPMSAKPEVLYSHSAASANGTFASEGFRGESNTLKAHPFK